MDLEQNRTFSDHYLKVNYDLSSVMFICTPNGMNILGYIEEEKSNVVKRYLLLKQTKLAGLRGKRVEVFSYVVMDILFATTQKKVSKRLKY